MHIWMCICICANRTWTKNDETNSLANSYGQKTTMEVWWLWSIHTCSTSRRFLLSIVFFEFFSPANSLFYFIIASYIYVHTLCTNFELKYLLLCFLRSVLFFLVLWLLLVSVLLLTYYCWALQHRLRMLLDPFSIEVRSEVGTYIYIPIRQTDFEQKYTYLHTVLLLVEQLMSNQLILQI